MAEAKGYLCPPLCVVCGVGERVFEQNIHALGEAQGRGDGLLDLGERLERRHLVPQSLFGPFALGHIMRGAEDRSYRADIISQWHQVAVEPDLAVGKSAFLNDIARLARCQGLLQAGLEVRGNFGGEKRFEGLADEVLRRLTELFGGKGVDVLNRALAPDDKG
ncbi:MAG: hypothetical protein M1482_06325 [Chloroflexi bacterium]|nr:hypothetical protein [Chloroflexota bacterium]